jgi:hypothetical protein
MMLWSKSDVALYLCGILGSYPAFDRQGRVKIPGPSTGCHQRNHEAIMHRSGRWACPNCSAGELHDYQARRSGLFSTCMYPERRASEAIEAIIRQEIDRRRERAQQAQALALQLALPRPAAMLVRIIYRYPGSSHRHLQQGSHMTRTKFNTAIRSLERGALVTYQDVPSTGGRVCRLYFPAATSALSDTSG